ncbi:hypothetical protein CIB93_24515 [Streptomyces sp. WZ.A104]|uniref:hypothetical protein n=1 Tax=Streptomyces sp. WZ.A104 TaxID=2023771 RepID=UPI000BBC25B8|nr:hypothetical protein [Streptomyces sp. WZ.A104]PCG83410.1 hypothetical protein CIB93_24515 [Streptomyces sp. WZ.A104]
MNASRRHFAKGWLTAIALSTLVLTGCGQKSADHTAPSAAAKPVSFPTADDTADATDAARSEDGDKAAPPATSGKQRTTPPSQADRTSFRTDADRKSAGAAAPSSAPTAPAGSKDTSGTTAKAPFAGTEQFVTISRAWTSDGRTYLSVRTAQKKINTRFDTWEITPGTGSFTTVPMAKNGRLLLAVPVRGEVAGTSRAELLGHSPAELVTLINRLDPALSDGIGYDLEFDGAGQVTGLTSLYRP